MRVRLLVAVLIAAVAVVVAALVLEFDTAMAPIAENSVPAREMDESATRAPRGPGLDRGDARAPSNERLPETPPARGDRLFIAGSVSVKGGAAVDGDLSIRFDRDGAITVRAATLDADGGFRVGGLASGSYAITFDHPRYRPVAVDVVLDPDRPIRGLRVELERGAEADGRVLTPGGEPAPRMRLEWRALRAVTDRADDPLRVVSTDSSGRWSLGGLDAGSYEVRVFPAELGSAGESRTGRRVSITPGRTNRYDFTEPSAEALIVEVVNPDGTPVPGAHVRFRLRSTDRTRSGSLPLTDDGGETRLRGFRLGARLDLELLLEGSVIAVSQFDLDEPPDRVRLLAPGSP